MRLLLDAAGDTPIRFRAKIVDFEVGDQGVRATCADAGGVQADVLIGADGIGSTIRSKIAGEASPTECGYVFLACHSRIRASTCRPRICRPLLGKGAAVRADRHWWGKGLLVGSEEHARRKGVHLARP